MVRYVKNFQAKHKDWWLNTKVAGAGGPMIRPLEPAVRVVAPTTRLPIITVKNGISDDRQHQLIKRHFGY